MTVMAILQEVDKCMRCNGCVIGCKREWKMKQETIGVHKVAYDQRLAIKSQKRVDMGPFIRYSCWHCPDPPCAKRCPFDAISKKDDGAVDVDFALCNPNACQISAGVYPCVVDCQRGGYPKPGVGSDALYTPAEISSGIPGPHAQKCTLCSDRAGVNDTAVAFQNPTHATSAEITAVAERAHEPMCVYTCPAKAMKWDTRDNILAYLSDPANGYYVPIGGGLFEQRWVGNGSMFWASKKTLLGPPKADPFVEDHLAPAATGLFSGPLAKAAIVPTILVGGLMALSARRAANEEDLATEGEV